MANKIVQNHLILLNNVNVLHTFQRVKSYVFHGYFAFSSIQTVHVFIIYCLHKVGDIRTLNSVAFTKNNRIHLKLTVFNKANIPTDTMYTLVEVSSCHMTPV